MRSLFAVVMLAFAAGPARAHFLFLIPSPDQKSATLVFSDTLGPDEGVAITKASKTKLHALDADGKTIDVKMTEQKHHYDVTVGGKSPLMIGGVCEYGVLSKKGDPYLLMYYPKTVLTPKPSLEPKWMTNGTEQLPLEIVKSDGKLPRLKVLFRGKPLAGAEIVMLFDNADDVSMKTDGNGLFAFMEALDSAEKATKKNINVAGFRVKHVENKAGELDGMKYTEIRHYATLVGRSSGRLIEKDEKDQFCDTEETAVAAGDDKKADPAATKLLADARMARAVWHKFPGFSALVDINEDGRTLSANLLVSAEGRVTLDAKGDLVDKAADLLKKVKSEISSLVSHRLPGGPSDTPCAFTDDVKDHPQGRLITVLNDELHSSYRIRDRQILEVNRSMGPGGRFTITVLENVWTKEKTCLPAFYVVNSWDKSGNLKGSSSHRSEYVRMSAFDLPKSATTATASATGLSVREITFRGHKLGAVSSVRR